MIEYSIKKSTKYHTISWLILFLFILNLFASPVTAESATPAPVRKKPIWIKNINYLYQNDRGPSLWCVVYSTAMLLSHYKVDDPPGKIARYLNMPTRNNSYFSWKSIFSEEDSVEIVLQSKYSLETQKKIFVQLHDYHLKWIKDNLRQNKPIIAIYGRIQGHAIVLVGFDDKNLYINDPSGAFFYDSSLALKRKIEPKAWLKTPEQGRKYNYETVAVNWNDFIEFMKEYNYWGYLITAQKIQK
ncbi:MAG: C39 family peptidase [Vulcanimicrobiota bacterium]